MTRVPQNQSILNEVVAMHYPQAVATQNPIAVADAQIYRV
jgi:hypothetical protein